MKQQVCVAFDGDGDRVGLGIADSLVGAVRYRVQKLDVGLQGPFSRVPLFSLLG
jgi:hypothetical protein